LIPDHQIQKLSSEKSDGVKTTADDVLEFTNLFFDKLIILNLNTDKSSSFDIYRILKPSSLCELIIRL
jgi:hypothetical protein